MATNQKTDGTAKAVETTNGNAVVSDQSNFGLIGYTVTFQATPEQLNKLAALGALHLAQRGPASRVEKTLAGYKKSRAEKGPNWTRKDIGYSKEIESRFTTEMTKEIAKDCADPDKDGKAPLLGIPVTVQAWEYTPEARPVAYAEAKKIINGALEAKALSKLVKTVSFKGSVTAETALKNEQFIQAVDEDRKARVRAMFA